ncbi:hypothetical protein [Proteus faecis]|uniref:hypothetical protein n=1 Tax=Proteus faecis TaxID=2050967 RepID=UPI003CF51CB8
MNDIKMVSYNQLSQYLNDAENKSKKDISFLLTNKITLCVNNEDSILNEIKKNDDFFVLENNDKILYIDSILINNLIKSIESAINEYIKENDSNLNEIKKFSLDEDVKKIISLNSDNVEIKSVHQVDDVINILNKLCFYTSSSQLLEKLSSIEEVKLILSKKKYFFYKLKKIKINDKIFSIKEIDKTIKSVDNKKNIFPNSILSLNKKFSLLTLDNSIDFNIEYKKNKQKETSKLNRLVNSHKIDDKVDSAILKRIEEKKDILKKHIDTYDQIYKIINKVQGCLYLNYKVNCFGECVENIDDIKKDLDFLISNLAKKNASVNGIQERRKIEKFQIDNIPMWDFAQKKYKNVTEKLNKHTSGLDKLSSDELIVLDNDLALNIPLIKDDLDKIETKKTRIMSVYENFDRYINDTKLNNNITLLIEDKELLKESFNKLSDEIYTKINYRKQSFFSSIYKFFFPSSYSKIINDLEKNKMIIYEALEYLYILDNYLEPTIENYSKQLDEYLFEPLSKYFKINLNDNLSVVDDSFFINKSVNLISELSFKKDFFDYFNDSNVNIKNILNSIFSSK